MSKEGDRQSVLRTTKVRTALKGDNSWIQRQQQENLEKDEEEKPWVAEVRANRSSGVFEETSPVSSPTVSVPQPISDTEIPKAPASGYLIRGVFKKTDSKPTSNSSTNGYAGINSFKKKPSETYKKIAPHTIRSSNEKTVQSEPTLSPEEKEKRTEAASSVLKGSAANRRSYVMSAAKKYESTETPDSSADIGISFVAKRVDISDDDDTTSVKSVPVQSVNSNIEPVVKEVKPAAPEIKSEPKPVTETKPTTLTKTTAEAIATSESKPVLANTTQPKTASEPKPTTGTTTVAETRPTARTTTATDLKPTSEPKPAETKPTTKTEPKPATETKTETKTTIQTITATDLKPTPEPKPAETKPTTKTEPKPATETKTETKTTIQTITATDLKPTSEPKPAETKPTTKIEPKPATETKTETKTTTQTITATDLKPTSEPKPAETKPTTKIEPKPATETKTETKTTTQTTIATEPKLVVETKPTTQTTTATEPKPTSEPKPVETKPTTQIEPKPATETKSETKSTTQTTTATESKLVVETKSTTQTITATDPKPTSALNLAETKPTTTDPKPATETKTEPKTTTQTTTATESKIETKSTTKTTIASDPKPTSEPKVVEPKPTKTAEPKPAAETKPTTQTTPATDPKPTSEPKLVTETKPKPEVISATQLKPTEPKPEPVPEKSLSDTLISFSTEPASSGQADSGVDLLGLGLLTDNSSLPQANKTHKTLDLLADDLIPFNTSTTRTSTDYTYSRKTLIEDFKSSDYDFDPIPISSEPTKSPQWYSPPKPDSSSSETYNDFQHPVDLVADVPADVLVSLAEDVIPVDTKRDWRTDMDSYKTSTKTVESSVRENLPESEPKKSFVYVKEYVDNSPLDGSSSDYVSSTTSNYSYSSPSYYSRRDMTPCTYCGEMVGNDAKITIEHLNISCHPSCFKCGICSKPMGDLLYNMFLHRGTVHCESCYSNVL
ncbi:zinc finger protein 185 isoform X1 [Carassius gibelio]|uniref:zinc finger protein 185 isoform X1 n=1 Tax=Carassius gibelio TaxID=101364 RepID=UPI002277477C|nr:zinc finger protein 185 isoform X1 [Carassius gibelio]